MTIIGDERIPIFKQIDGTPTYVPISVDLIRSGDYIAFQLNPNERLDFVTRDGMRFQPTQVAGYENMYQFQVVNCSENYVIYTSRIPSLTISITFNNIAMENPVFFQLNNNLNND